MRISKANLKKIIREEYSRLKKAGLISESMPYDGVGYNRQNMSNHEFIANLIVDAWDDGLSFPEAVDGAFEGQGMPFPAANELRGILQLVESQWGMRSSELDIGAAIDQYIAEY